MPFIDRADTLFSELPVAPRPEVESIEEVRPDASAVLGAAFRQNNIVSSLYERLTTEGLDTFTTPPRVEDYDPFTDISGFEDFAERFVRSGSPAETLRIKERIRSERTDRDILRRAGGWGVASSMAAGVIDPITIGSMLIPVAPGLAGASRGTRIAAGVGGQIAFDSTVEAMLHSSQELRTPGESVLNVGAGALLVGALGTIATRVPKGELDAVREQLRAKLSGKPILETSPTGQSTAGAAEVSTGTTLADEGIATIPGRLIAASFGKASITTRLLQQPFKSARILTQRLAEVPYTLGKHLKGFKSEDSVDTLIKRLVNIGRYQTTKNLNDAFVDYKKSGGTLSHKQFSEEAANAMDNADVSDIPQIAKAIGWAREQFDADKKLLRELGFDISDEVMGAKSYFPRIYDVPRIMANQLDFENRLFQWFKANPKVPEAGDVIAEVESRLSSMVSRRGDMRTQGISDDAAPAVALDLEIQAARQALASKRAKLKAVETSGTTRTEANRVLAEAEAEQAVKDVEQQLKETEVFRESAESATKEARTANRRVSRIKRQANIIASRIRVLSRQLADMNTDAPKRSVADIELQLSKTQKVLAEKRKGLKAALAARKGTSGEARKAAEQAVAAARAERDEISEEVFRIRSERNLARQAGDPIEAFGRLDARIARLQAKLDKTRLSAYDARAVANQFRQIARGVLKEFKDQSAKLAARKEVAKEAKTRAAKAVPEPREDAEIFAEVRSTIDEIMQMPAGRAQTFAAGPSPLKSRVLDVPNEILKPYLVRDFEKVMSGYFRSIVPEITLRSKGLGPEDFDLELQKIKEEADIKQAAAKTDKEKAEISKKYNATLEDLRHLYKRLTGHVGPTNGGVYGSDRRWIRAGRVARAFAYVRTLGGQMLSSMNDYGKLITRYGLSRTLVTTGKFLTNWNANKLSRDANHRIGVALEMLVDTKSREVGDILDELPITRLEQGTQWVTNQFSRLTLMSPWNAMIKHLSAAMEQDQFLRIVRGKKLTPFQKANMLRNGFDDADFEKLGAMFEKHGEDFDGLFRARTELWEDQELALKVETAILKAGDEIMSARGIGDLPVMMDKELLKTILQFKSFAITSVNRTMIPVAQGLAMGDARVAQGVMSMFAIGMFTYYVKELAAGRQPDTSPGRLVAEALNWSGMLGYFPELWDPIASTVNLKGEDGKDLLPRFSRFKSRSPMESWAGPTFGSTQRMTVALLNQLSDAGMTQADVHSIRQMLPLQNLFYTRRLFNAIEGEVGEAVNAEGSTVRTFGERVAEETPTK